MDLQRSMGGLCLRGRRSWWSLLIDREVGEGDG
jgi:hypothetical protein